MKRKKFTGIANFSGVAEIGIYVAVYKSEDCAMKMKRHVKRGTGGKTVDEKVIDLTNYDSPDCKVCTDQTKRITGMVFDAEGPGITTAIYTCKNRKCRKIRNVKAMFLLRREIYGRMDL